ncbi:MAG: hypothetical protein COA63_013100 [Methylophaga sp.]|nr:hypothetical protein [Methylophaga sp.]
MEIIEHKIMVMDTSQENYLTGITALNIPIDECTGDWHFSACFVVRGDAKPPQQRAGIELLSTSKWLGRKGIYDCYSVLVEHGLKEKVRHIYAADHYRAIADMVYYKVKNGRSINRTISLNDWLPEPHEKERLYQMIDLLKPAMNNEEWGIIEKWKQLTAIPD